MAEKIEATDGREKGRKGKWGGGKLWEYGRKEVVGERTRTLGGTRRDVWKKGISAVFVSSLPLPPSPPPPTHTSTIDRFESESSKNSNTTDTLGHKGSIGDRKRREMRLGEEDSELFSFLLGAQHTMLYTSPFLLLLFLSHARMHVPADREV